LTAGYRQIPRYFDLPPARWRVWKLLLATRTDVSWQTEYFTLFRVVDPHPPRTLPALPVVETLHYAAADEALGHGRTSEALAAYTNPPPLLQDVGSTYARQGDAWLAIEKLELAELAFRRALERGADNHRIRMGLAQIQLRRGKPERGLPHAESAWRQHPLSAYAAATLALTYDGVGRRDEAVELIREAIRLRPDEADYRELARRLGALKNN